MPRFRNLLSPPVFALWGFFLVLIASGYVAAKEITPTDNFCRVINDPMTGNEVILNPGVYRGPCIIRRGGEPDRPLIIRAKSETDRPRINYDGNSANVLEVRADHVIIKGLAFGPTHVDAIRIRANRDVTVIDCEFVEIEGIAVVANQSSLQGLVVSRNRVRDSRSTAMYFGCHDGYACRMSGIIIEKNRIDGVTAAVNEIGYGIQVKLNSSAIIRDNAIKDTKGPGIMVYGGHDTSTESLIERNFVSGSRTSSGIVIGGGPAIVRNNISLFSAVSGIGLEDYGQRGLLRHIKLGFNSVYGNKMGGITAPQGKVADTLLVGNVGWNDSTPSVFPPEQSGLSESDNISCEQACFADPANFDFSPVSGSALDRHAVAFQAEWLPEVDFFGNPRKSPPRAGAVEGVGQPWRVP